MKEWIKAQDKINDLAQKALKGKLVLFIGAGISRNSSLPDWEQLLKQVLNQWPEGLKLIHKVSPLKLLDTYVTQLLNGNTTILKEEIAKIISSAEIKADLSKVHLHLSQLPIERIYTTNYDTLLNKTFPSAYPIFSERHFADYNPEEGTCVIYFHGCVKDSSNMKVTWSDFLSFWKQNQLLETCIKSDLWGKTILFLGYSFRDPHLEDLLREFQGLYCEKKNPHYAIFLSDDDPDLESEVMLNSLRKLNIEPLIVKNKDELTILLENLANIVKTEKQNSDRSMPGVMTDLSAEWSKHIKEEDLSPIADFHEQGNYDSAIDYIEKLLSRLETLHAQHVISDDDICFILSKKIFYLLLADKIELSKQELGKALLRFPKSPWLIAESLRELIRTNNIDKSLTELSKVKQEYRDKVVLFDIFEINLLLRTGDLEKASRMLENSIQLKADKYYVQRRILEAEILLEKKEFSFPQFLKAIAISCELRDILSDPEKTSRAIKQSSNEIRELYVRSILAYEFGQHPKQPPIPIFLKEANPFHDFKKNNYYEIFNEAWQFITWLLKVTKDQFMKEQFLMQKIALNVLLEEEFGIIEDKSVFTRTTIPKEIKMIEDILIKYKAYLHEGNRNELLEKINQTGWKENAATIPITARLSLGWIINFILGLNETFKEEVDDVDKNTTNVIFKDYENSEFGIQANALFAAAYNLGAFKELKETAKTLRNIIDSRPYSLFWIEVIEEMLLEFIEQGYRLKKQGFHYFVSLGTLERAAYIPANYDKNTIKNIVENDNNEIKEIRALLIYIATKRYELLPTKANLLKAADLVLTNQGKEECWNFLGDKLNIEWDNLSKWSKKEFLKVSMASKFCYLLGVVSSDPQKTENAFKESYKIAISADLKNIAAQSQYGLAKFYIGKGKRDDAKRAFERCVESTSNIDYFLAYSAFLLSENLPKEAWKILQEARKITANEESLATQLFAVGLRIGGEEEREAFSLLKKYPEIFKLQEFKFDKKDDKDKLVDILKKGRERAERIFEAYSWGKMPLVNVAENLKTTCFSGLWLYLTRVRKMLMCRWPAPDLYASELKFAESKEVVLDVSSLYTVVSLGIQDRIIESWDKIICSKSLWDFVHNEVIQAQQNYREEEYQIHKKFKVWLGDIFDSKENVSEVWKERAKKRTETLTDNLLIGDIYNICWAEERNSLWLLMFADDQRVKCIKELDDKDRESLVTIFDIFKVLEERGEITETDKETLTDFAKKYGCVTSEKIFSENSRTALWSNSKKRVLIVDFASFHFLDSASKGIEANILDIIKRSFEITILPWDLNSFKEELNKHEMNSEACQFSIKVRDVVLGWRQLGKLDIEEAEIIRDNTNEFISAEHFGVPWTEMALAIQKKVTFLVDDLGTFEFFKQFMQGKPHPTSWIPALILRQLELTDKKEDCSYWYERLEKLWHWGFFSMPYSGILSHKLNETNWNFDSRIIKDLTTAMTRFFEFEWTLKKLTPEDMNVGVSFREGAPDPLIIARFSLFPFIKEVARAITDSNIQIFLMAKKEERFKITYPSAVSRKLLLLAEECVNKLEKKILTKQDKDVADGKKISQKLALGDLFKSLPLLLVFHKYDIYGKEERGIGIDGREFLNSCFKVLFQDNSEFYSKEIRQMALSDSYAKIINDFLGKIIENSDSFNNYEMSFDQYIQKLINVQLFLEFFIAVPYETRVESTKDKVGAKNIIKEIINFLIHQFSFSNDLTMEYGFLGIDGIRGMSLAYILHLEFDEVGQSSQEIYRLCFELLKEMCNQVVNNMNDKEKRIQGIIAIKKILQTLPDQQVQDFLSKEKISLEKIGFNIIQKINPNDLIKLKISEVKMKINDAVQRDLNSLLGEQLAKEVSGTIADELFQWIKDDLSQFDSHKGIISFLESMIKLTEKQPFIDNDTLAKLSVRRGIFDVGVFNTLISVTDIRNSLKKLILASLNPEVEKKIIGVLIHKYLIPIFRAEIIDNKELSDWFIKALKDTGWQSSPEKYTEILREACIAVSIELNELKLKESVLFDSINQIGYQLTDKVTKTIFLEETKFLTVILSGHFLVKLKEVRDTIEKSLNG